MKVKLGATFIIMLAVVCLLSSVGLAAPLELSLEDSIQRAWQHNRDIKMAEIAKEKAMWSVKEAQGNKGVSLDFLHTDKRYSTETAVGNEYSSNRFDNQLSLSYSLYSGGKLENTLDKAKLGVTIADAGIANTKQQLTETVTSYYFTLLQYQKEVEIGQETVSNYAAHLKNVQNQYDIGTVAKVDVLSSQVELADAEDTLIQAKANYQVAMAKLNDAMGLPLEQALQLKETLGYEKWDVNLVDCREMALRQRPEILQYQAKISSAEKDIAIAESAKRPEVTASLNQNWYDKNLPGVEHSNWQLTLTTSFNVFDSGVNQAKIKQTEESLASVKQEEQAQRETILLEVQQAYVGLKEAQKRIETKQAAIEQAEESLKIAEARYEAGMGTNLAVFDAVVALNKAKINNVKALYDYKISKAQLEKAMGMEFQKK